MPVKLKVPFVTQHHIGGPINKKTGQHTASGNSWNDWTGCWYASACMVGYYFNTGPRQGVPEIFVNGGHHATGSQQANQLSPNHHELLAKRERLAPVAKCATNHSYTVDELEELLRQGGPIFMYWMKSHNGNTYGHASVIIGTTKYGIIYHDPENSPNSSMTIAQFNSARQSWKYALMQKNTGSKLNARKAMFGG